MAACGDVLRVWREGDCPRIDYKSDRKWIRRYEAFTSGKQNLCLCIVKKKKRKKKELHHVLKSLGNLSPGEIQKQGENKLLPPGPASMDLICFPDSRSHRRICASRELEAAMAPWWLMSTETTPSWWPSRVHCSSSFSSDLQEQRDTRATSRPSQSLRFISWLSHGFDYYFTRKFDRMWNFSFIWGCGISKTLTKLISLNWFH